MYFLEKSFLEAEVPIFKCSLYGVEFIDEENYNEAFGDVTETIKPHEFKG